MRCFPVSAVAAIFMVGAAGITAAQTPAPPAAVPNLDDLVGKKLTAIDGSSIALNAAEGGVAREIVSANGAIQRSYFAFLTENLGTVADPSDLRKITGVFRRSGGALDIQYADGSSELLRLNSGGGLTLEKVSAASTSCVSWYPEGHAFSVEERKAALAAFAVRLGLADPGTSNSTNPDCMSKTAPAEVKPPTVKAEADMPKPDILPPKPATAAITAADAGKSQSAAPPSARSAKTVLAASSTAPAEAAPTAAAVAAEAHEIEVRQSEVHLIDPVPTDEAKPQVLASATPPPAITPDAHGASACLSVESDGLHWGFRNHCGYVVQFAYCLMAGTQLASCRDGAVAGSVAANGFGALIADESLKETDAEHNFRWVACPGGAGEVIPHLDQVDPPSGRCVR